MKCNHHQMLPSKELTLAPGGLTDLEAVEVCEEGVFTHDIRDQAHGQLLVGLVMNVHQHADVQGEAIHPRHILDADSHLEVLVVGDHLGEKRPLHHTHHRGLSLGVRLLQEAERERGKKRGEKKKKKKRGPFNIPFNYSSCRGLVYNGYTLYEQVKYMTDNLMIL